MIFTHIGFWYELEMNLYKPAGPTMLWWLPPKRPAANMVQIAVMKPDSGDASAAIPRDMESGI